MKNTLQHQERLRETRETALRKMRSLFSMGAEPSVDVIVVNYNYGKFLEQCLESVAALKYGNWRCLIVDDASTDDSVGIAESFARNKPKRFKLARSESNRGQMECFKIGLEATSGEFVLFVDADDVIFPSFISVHLSAHFFDRSVAFTSSRMAAVNTAGELIAGDAGHPGFERLPDYYQYVHPQPLFNRCWRWSATSGMLFRRSVIKQALPRDTEPFRSCADYFLCHFANLIGGSLLINETLGLYRLHSENRLANSAVYGLETFTWDLRRHCDHQTVVRPLLAEQLIRSAPELVPSLGSRGWLARFMFVARAESIESLWAVGDKVGLSPRLIFAGRVFRIVNLAVGGLVNLLAAVAGLTVRMAQCAYDMWKGHPNRLSR